MINTGILVIGLVVLLAGARLTVDNAVVVARHYHLSDFFIGVVILAIGSDLPELVISINAGLHQLQGIETSGIIIGNALGSNFSQIGLIMGVAGLVGYLTLSRRYIYLHGGILLGAILYLALAMLDGKVTRLEGGILVLAFLIYVIMLFEEERTIEKPPITHHFNLMTTWVLLVMGMALVIGGSEVTIRATVTLAEQWGVSQSFIAIVIIGVGSSLPELSISISALSKARGGMSVGNLIGSNIIDTLLPVGLAGLIHPLRVEPGLISFDLPALFVLTVIVLVLFAHRRGLQKVEAAILVSLYGVYLLLKLFQF
jgi:cation:H+ antiporter